MIIVDKREKNSLVISELIRRKIPIEIKQLEIGDYIIGDTIIERKTKSDFISSIINKRLLEQLNNMKQFPNKLLVLEEDPTCCERNINIHPNAIRGMILSISLDFHTPIIHTSGYNETVDFLEVLNKRYENGGKEISLKMKKKARNMEEQQQFIIESFPGIGPKLAKQLLKENKTVKNIINLREDDIQKIKKLNKKRAKLIYTIINSEYK